MGERRSVAPARTHLRFPFYLMLSVQAIGLLVRHTVIGRLLNGKRMRGEPAVVAT